MKKISNGLQLIANASIAIGCVAWAMEIYEGSILQDKVKGLISKFHKKS